MWRSGKKQGHVMRESFNLGSKDVSPESEKRSFSGKISEFFAAAQHRKKL
jgi:hypothetical protein